MKIRRLAALLVLLFFFCGPLLACGPEADEELRQTEAELRPTDPSDPAGYEGASTDTFESPLGHVRVWWATEGTHQPRQGDQNGSGIPDYVEMVADIGDEVGEFLEAQGWRRPLTGPVTSGSHGSTEPLDLFLVNFTAGDGNFRQEHCGFDGSTTVCSGHLRVDNDFFPLYYPSVEYALRVVISHEFFHAVQYAYNADMPAWWAEGSATWFQEYFWEEQDDFERLTRHYFQSPDRSLHDRQRGAFDSFAYGAAIFVYFLELHIGAEGVREIHEAMAEDLGILEALDEVLSARWVPLSEAFANFAAFNLFTGSRAVAGEGYPEAQRFEEVDFVELGGGQNVNWDVAVDGLAAKYGHMDMPRDLALTVRDLGEFERATVLAVSTEEFAEGGVFHVLDDETPTYFASQDFPIFLVVANGSTEENQAVQIRIRGGTPEEPDDGEEEPVVVDDTDEEVEAGGCSAVGKSGGSTVPVFFVGLMALLMMSQISKRRRSKDAVIPNSEGLRPGDGR